MRVVLSFVSSKIFDFLSYLYCPWSKAKDCYHAVTGTTEEALT